MPVTVAGLQHKIIGLQIVGRALCRGSRFASADIGRKLCDNFRGELALDGENVGDLPVKAARPKVRAGIDIDKLRRDAELVALTARAALDHIVNAELCPQLAYIGLLTAYGKSGVACNDLKLGVPGERRGHVFCQAIRKVRLIPAAAHVGERHDGNRRSRVLSGLVQRQRCRDTAHHRRQRKRRDLGANENES